MNSISEVLTEIWRRTAQLEPVSLVLGIIATLLNEKLFDIGRSKFARRIERRRWRRTNRDWENYSALVSEFDVIQAGWKERRFGEEDAIITVEGDFAIKPPFSELCTARTPEWESKALKNNVQIGVKALDPHRTSEELGDKTHLLLMRGHRFKYFEFLGTNRLLSQDNAAEALAAARAAGNPDWTKPVSEFANPVSVGLTLLCEGGECLVLTRRTEQESSGGLWYAGLKFNAVGETVNPRDVVEGVLPGVDTVSPWNTARRALGEEVGFSSTDVPATELVLHSFVFDRRIRDYKFFGHAITKLARQEVYDRWLYAPDKSETKQLFFWDTKSSGDRRVIVRNIVDERQDWTAEAVFSTLWTFAYLGWVKPKDVGGLRIGRGG